MAFRINKTSKIVIGIGVVILSGALGFLIWRVNQEESTAPEESEAGSNQCNCCPNNCSSGPDYLSCVEDLKNNSTLPICDLEPGGTVDCECVYSQASCASVPLCASECNEGSDCSPCTWPEVAFCISGNCECKDHAYNTIDPCKDTQPTCTLECPDGYHSPYFSNTCGAGEKSVQCIGSCAGCDNPYIAKGCCKPLGSTCGNGIKETGEACDPNASPTGCNSGYICKSNCTCEAVVTNCGNGTLNSGEECEVGNPSGTSCTWDDCNQTSCTCRQLTITKSAVKSCLNTDTESPIAELTYTITMKNADTVDNRTITKVKDVLDPKILAAGIVPTGIASPGTYSNGNIVWKYDTTNLIIKPGETKTLTYKVNIDKDHFGEYTNTVTMTRSSGVTSQATATILADCDLVTPLATCGNGVLDAGESCELGDPDGVSCEWDSCNKSVCTCISPSTPTPTVPQTGIFDSTLGRIGAGIALLIIGGVVYTIPNGVLVIKKKENTYRYRAGFEKRVANR